MIDSPHKKLLKICSSSDLSEQNIETFQQILSQPHISLKASTSNFQTREITKCSLLEYIYQNNHIALLKIAFENRKLEVFAIIAAHSNANIFLGNNGTTLPTECQRLTRATWDSQVIAAGYYSCMALYVDGYMKVKENNPETQRFFNIVSCLEPREDLLPLMALRLARSPEEVIPNSEHSKTYKAFVDQLQSKSKGRDFIESRLSSMAASSNSEYLTDLFGNLEILLADLRFNTHAHPENRSQIIAAFVAEYSLPYHFKNNLRRLYPPVLLAASLIALAMVVVSVVSGDKEQAIVGAYFMVGVGVIFLPIIAALDLFAVMFNQTLQRVANIEGGAFQPQPQLSTTCWPRCFRKNTNPEQRPLLGDHLGLAEEGRAPVHTHATYST